MSTHFTIAELKALLPRRMRLLGLDVGSKTIGLALSDTTLTIATPMETIKRTKFKDDAARLMDIVTKQGVGGFIIGWPVNMDGSEGPRCQSTRAFSAVERTLIEANRSRSRRKELVDKMAAAYILQGALHAL